jgi:hypothetical protein
MDPTAVEFDHGTDVTTALGGSFVIHGQVAGQIVGTQIVWTVPRDLPEIMLPSGAAAAGYKLDKISAHSEMLVGSVGTFFADDGPDTGSGTPFVFGSASAKPIYADVTTAAFTLVAKSPTKSNQTYVYNWTNAQADVDLAFGAAATTGTAHVVVKDSANVTVLDKRFPADANGTVELKDAKSGKWQVTVAYANFTGALGLSIAKHEAGSTATTSASGSSSTTAAAGSSTSGSASGSSSSGSGTASSSTTKKGTPTLGVALLVAALGVAVAVRRRL